MSVGPTMPAVNADVPQPTPKAHDLAHILTSGLLDKLGYALRPGTYDEIFREPDAVRCAFT